jgi:acyl transferase domain-containing protein/NADPH:quinone reductase-like Zn-dependent oxidoreductase/acyl carrier protein
MTRTAGTKDRTALLNEALVALERMQKKLAVAEAAAREPVAVVGMGCRWPGHCDTPEAFWNMLRDGTDALVEVPPERWAIDDYYDSDPGAAGKMYTRRAGFLDQVDQFDAKFFGITPREAAGIDPQQRLMLEVGWEALEDAGIAPSSLKGSNTGVFVGIGSSDYAQMSLASTQIAEVDAYTGSGGGNCFAAGRLSYTLGLRGPSLIVDTACSSSLVAVHLACQSLRLGECDLALAGGVNLILSPLLFVYLSRTSALSADGKCKVFDERADGFARGEGCGVIALKRLSDALAGRHRILAVIKGSAVNQDGASSGLTVPNGTAQRQVITAALSNAGLEPADISFVETHGTGTSLGDPIELGALTAALGKGRPADRLLTLGGVKANVGHAEAAAGIAGLMKVVLCIQHKEIPAQIHFERLNPHIDTNGVPISIPQRHTGWAGFDGQHLAGVSSFGLSGTNAHVILGDPPRREAATADFQRSRHLLTLSAKSAAALQALAARYVQYLPKTRNSFGDICFTANTGRPAFEYRLSLVAESSLQAAERLESWIRTGEAPGVVSGRFTARKPPKLAFLFTGQGSQYPEMGRDLYESQPVFRAAFDRCAELVQSDLDAPLRQVIGFAEDDAKNALRLLDETAFTQPVLFAFEYALARMWRSWGIEPTVVAGHSLGEFVAACVAGALSLEDALALVTRRARLMQALPGQGAMIAVLTSEDRTRAAIEPYRDSVSVAAVNTPENTVISGKAADVREVAAKLAGQGIEIRPLTVSHAFHSAQVEPMLDEFERSCRGVETSRPSVPLILNLTGRPADDATSLGPVYWRRHAREAVRFADSVQAMIELGSRAFLEIGPAPVLLGMASQCTDDPQCVWLASARKGQNAVEQALSSLGALYVQGFQPDWNALNEPFRRQLVDVPTTPFQPKRHWLPAATMAAASPARRPESREGNRHPWLRRQLASPLREIQFECALDVNETPILREHQIASLPILPAAAFIELGCAAAREVFGSYPARIERGWLQSPLVLDNDGRQDVHLIVTRSGEHSAEFEVFSRLWSDAPGKSWTRHAGGTLVKHAKAAAGDGAGETPQRRSEPAVDLESYRLQMADAGLEYGSSFRSLSRAWRGDREAYGEICLPRDDRLADHVGVHPGMLDSAFHLIGVALQDHHGGSGFYLPVSYESAEVMFPLGSEAEARATIRIADPQRIVADVTLSGKGGIPAVRVRGLTVRPATRDQLRNAVAARQGELLKMTWRKVEKAAPVDTDGEWYVLGGDAPLGARVTDGLARRKARARRIADETDLAALLQGGAQDLAGIVDLRNTLDRPAGSVRPSDEIRGSATKGSVALLRAIATSSLPRPPRILIATRDTHRIEAEDRVDPRNAAVWGIAATAAAELSNADVRLIDVDDPSSCADAIVDAALREDDETRLASRANKLSAPRLAGLETALAGELALPSGPYRLTIRDRGTLSGLAIEPLVRVPPGPGQVEIEVLATGLNFRDVLNLLDMYPGEAGLPGNECCGRIVSVGPGVEGLQAGTLVACISDATFSSHVIANASLVFPVPPALSISQAAAFPIAQLTAYYALHTVGRISAGKRVLIHAGAGGVGLAAVHLALAAGATVLATAGSRDKRDYLLGLGVERVFDSRQPLAAETVMDATGRQGVDLLLNALTGKAISEGLRSLSPGGQFLEIGLRELWSMEQVREIRADVTYHPLMLGGLCTDDPDSIRAMYAALSALLDAGQIPAPPVRSFPITAAESAFRFLAQARHVGRIAVTHPALGRGAIRDDAAYLVTGGLGALGLHTAAWLAERGARQILLLGRSAPTPAASQRIDALRARGIEVDVRQADVSIADDLSFLGEWKGRPLRGVFHAAGILDDATLPGVDADRLQRLMRPKADGVLNISRATASSNLDLFVLYSSAAAVFGSPGQAAYAGANAFLDAFAHVLQSEGRAAVSVNWGAWRDGGMAAGVTEQVASDWEARGIGALSTSEAFSLLEAAAGSGLPQLVAHKTDWTRYFSALGSARAPALLADLAPSRTSSGPVQVVSVRAALVASLGKLPRKQQLRVLSERLRDEAAKVLGMDAEDLELRDGLTEQGMDSLMAVELANRLCRMFEVSLPTTFAFDYPTLGALATHLLQQILPESNGLPASRTAADATTTAEDLSEMTESELETELRRELDQAGF